MTHKNKNKMDNGYEYQIKSDDDLSREIMFGYLREAEVSGCQDDCSQYYIEPEVNPSFGMIPVIFQNLDLNMDLYVDRFVEVELGQQVTCVECSAYEINQIILSGECESSVNCIADPCEVAAECQVNTPVDCVANYCGVIFSLSLIIHVDNRMLLKCTI